MKNLFLAICLCVCSASCAPKVVQSFVGTIQVPAQTIIGEWGGEIVGGMFVEFDFGYLGDYEQRTYSVNDVLISAHQGSIKIWRDNITFYQRREFDKIWIDKGGPTIFVVHIVDDTHIKLTSGELVLELTKNKMH